MIVDSVKNSAAVMINGELIGSTIEDKVSPLSGLTITWGRSSLYDKPVPAVLDLIIKDRYRRWTGRLVELLGAQVSVFMTDDPDQITGASIPIFDGFVTAASPSSGLLIKIEASDRLLQLDAATSYSQPESDTNKKGYVWTENDRGKAISRAAADFGVSTWLPNTNPNPQGGSSKWKDYSTYKWHTQSDSPSILDIANESVYRYNDAPPITSFVYFFTEDQSKSSYPGIEALTGLDTVHGTLTNVTFANGLLDYYQTADMLPAPSVSAARLTFDGSTFVTWSSYGVAKLPTSIVQLPSDAFDSETVQPWSVVTVSGTHGYLEPSDSDSRATNATFTDVTTSQALHTPRATRIREVKTSLYDSTTNLALKIMVSISVSDNASDTSLRKIRLDSRKNPDPMVFQQYSPGAFVFLGKVIDKAERSLRNIYRATNGVFTYSATPEAHWTSDLTVVPVPGYPVSTSPLIGDLSQGLDTAFSDFKTTSVGHLAATTNMEEPQANG